MKERYKFGILVLLLCLTVSCSTYAREPMNIKDNAIQKLKQFSTLDNFAEEKGSMYTGVHDPILRANLNNKLETSIHDFITAINNKATKEQYIELLSKSINSFDRQTLDTEDAEQVAKNFQKIMDYIGLDSSDGVLNKWLYGFTPK